MDNISKRLNYIDSLKGFAIFLVVMGHVIAWQFADHEQTIHGGLPQVALWWHFIYAFHMPLFMFLSGFLFPRIFVCAKDISVFLLRKVQTLILPLITFSFLANYIFANSYSGGVDYWFLRGLFFIIIINLGCEVISSFVKKSIVIDVIYYLVMYVVLIKLSRMLPHNVSSLIGLSNVCNANYLAFCFGTLCKKYDIVRQIIEQRNSYTLCVLCFLFFFIGSVKGYNEQFYWMIPLICIPLSAIVCCWQLFRFEFAGGKIVGWLQFLGKHSLEIYLLHFLFAIKMPIVGELVSEYVAMDNWRTDATASCLQLIHAIVVSVIICLLCIATFKILRYSPMLSLLMFGRKQLKG